MTSGGGTDRRERRFDLWAFAATGAVAGLVGACAWLILAVGFGALVASLAVLVVVGGGGALLLAGGATRRSQQCFAGALVVSFVVALLVAAGPVADAVR